MGLFDLNEKKISEWNFIYIFIVIACLLFSLIFAVVNLQIVQGAELTDRADLNQVELTYEYPKRGVIFDRHGEKLAHNVAATNLVLDLEHLYEGDSVDQERLNEALSEVERLVGDRWKDLAYQEDEDIALIDYVNEKIAELEEKDGYYARFANVLLVQDLDNDMTIKIKSERDRLKHVRIEEGFKRFYPFKSYFSHVLGYTGIITAEDLANVDYLGYEKFVAMNGFKDIIGKLGVEAVYDKKLIGRKGIKAVETDAYGNEVSGVIQSVEEVQDGKNLHLSIDKDAQIKLQDLLKEAVKKHEASGAAGIVQDVKTGELIVYISYPGYDNNEFIGGISSEKYQKLLKNKHLPLLNRPISAQLPPGSTYKTLTALGALDSGAITRDTVYVSRGGYTFSSGASFQEYHGRSYGPVNVTDALSVSSNIFFCEVIRNWDINELVPYYEKFGIGKKTGVDLVGESAGRLPSPANKIKLARTPGITWLDPIWYPEGDGCNTVIGQGITLTTPLQMSNWTSAIANGGTLHTPHLAVGISSQNGDFEKLDYKPAAADLVDDKVLEIVREGMYLAVNGPRRSIVALSDSKIEVAAKTGTAEFGALNKKGQYEHSHAWVTGFFPYKNPRYTFVILLEDGGESYYSAQVAREFIDWWADNYKE